MDKHDLSAEWNGLLWHTITVSIIESYTLLNTTSMSFVRNQVIDSLIWNHNTVGMPQLLIAAAVILLAIL